MAEAKVQADIRLDCGFDVTLYRNNTGAFVDKNGRLVRFGLCKGSSDLVGDKTITVTPDMVGQQIAVAVYIECKDDDGKLTPEQVNFLEQARKRGALAGVARSVADARAILAGEAPSLPTPRTSRKFTPIRSEPSASSSDHSRKPARATGARKVKT